MPKDNIERAVKPAGGKDGTVFEEITSKATIRTARR